MDCNIQNIKCEICGRVFHKVCHAEPYEKVCDNSECFHKKFWLEIIKEKDEHVIINGICYYLDKAHPMSDSPFRGYGGRGIKICDEWDDFANFKEWAIISGYDNTAKRGTCTLDRINVNGNYSPENCRWNTMKEQSNNRRNTIYMTVNDETHSLSEWASITGIKYDTLWKRYKKYGWSPERVVS